MNRRQIPFFPDIVVLAHVALLLSVPGIPLHLSIPYGLLTLILLFLLKKGKGLWLRFQAPLVLAWILLAWLIYFMAGAAGLW